MQTSITIEPSFPLLLVCCRLLGDVLKCSFCFFTECKETEEGTEFRGTTFSETVTGLTCQRWDQDLPHKSYLNDDPSNMQELGLEGEMFFPTWSDWNHNITSAYDALSAKNNTEMQTTSTLEGNWDWFVTQCPLWWFFFCRELLQEPRWGNTWPLVLHHGSQYHGVFVTGVVAFCIFLIVICVMKRRQIFACLGRWEDFEQILWLERERT